MTSALLLLTAASPRLDSSTLPVSGVYIAEVTTSAAAVTGSFSLTVGSGQIAELKMTIYRIQYRRTPPPRTASGARRDRHRTIGNRGYELNRWWLEHTTFSQHWSWSGSDTGGHHCLIIRRATLCRKSVPAPTTLGFEVRVATTRAMTLESRLKRGLRECKRNRTTFARRRRRA